MALIPGGFLGASSPVSPRRTQQVSNDLTQQAVDAYVPGSNTGNPYTDPSSAYINAVANNPNSYGTVGMQRGTMVDRQAVRQQAAIDDQTRGLQTALDFFGGIYGPSLAQQQTYLDTLAGRQGFAEANFDTQRSILQDQFGIDLARIGLEEQGIGVERGAANRQITNADILESLARQLLGNTQQGFDVDIKSLATQERSSNQQHAAELRQAKSSAAARGAMSAPGIQRTQTELAQQLWNRNELIGQDRERVGLGRERANLGFERERVGLREQRAAGKDRLALLDIRSKGLGLDRQTLSNNLEQGIARLGIEEYTTVNDLLDAMNSTDLQTRAIAEQIYRSALEHSDFFAGLDPAGLAALGLGPKPPSGPLGSGGLTRPGVQ